jgi:hypothetical protein
MTIPKATIFAVIAMCALPVFGAVTRSDIEGTWTCDPYTMTGKNMTITVNEQHVYQKDGSHSEVDTSTIRLDGGITLTTKSRLSGSWQLADGVIELRKNSAKFLFSSNSNYTTEMGQRDLDAQLQKKNWSKMKVQMFPNRIVTTPINSMYKEARVPVTCRRT